MQSEANTFIQAALAGSVTNYFYVGSRKLVACPLMLTEATISRVMINAGGKWIEADVALTLKQASPLDGTKTASASGTGASGSKNATAAAVAAATAVAATVAKAGVKVAMAGVNAMINSAKQASITAKAGGSTTRVAMVK